jgi:O-antigen/teichoic acid export membrane protein
MLIKATLRYMPAQLLAPLLQFVAAVTWTHYMGAAEYGLFALAVAGQELADAICLAWWSHSTLRYWGDARTPDAQARYVATESAALGASLTAHAAVAFAAVALTDAPMTGALAAATVGFASSKALSTYLSERARAGGRIGLYTLLQLAGPAVGLGLAWLAVRFVSPGAVSALAGYALAQGASAVLAAVALGVGRFPARPSRDILVRALGYGLPLVAAGALSWVSINGVRLVVERTGSLSDVGLLSVGWGLGLRLASVAAMMFAAAAFPIALQRLRAGEKDQAMADLALNGALLLGLLAPMAAGLFYIAQPLVELLVAPAYREATVAVLPAAAAAGALRNWRVHFVDHAYLLVERTGVLTGICAVEAVLVILGCGLGFHLSGVPGAAWGAAAGVAGSLVAGLIVATSRFSLRPPLAAMARIALSTGVMCLALEASPLDVGGPGARIGAAVAMGAVVYAAAMLALDGDLRRALARAAGRASAARRGRSAEPVPN